MVSINVYRLDSFFGNLYSLLHTIIIRYSDIFNFMTLYCFEDHNTFMRKTIFSKRYSIIFPNFPTAKVLGISHKLRHYLRLNKSWHIVHCLCKKSYNIEYDRKKVGSIF